MSWLALGLICAFLVLVFPARTIRQRKWLAVGGRAWQARTRPPRWLLADVLFLVAFVLVVAGPALRVTGWLGAAWAAGVGAEVGVALLLGAAALATWAQETMGPAWRTDIAADRTTALITSGPFAIIRNPTYVAMLAAALGTLLLAPSALGIAGIGLLAASLVLTARYEEAELALVHGQAYREYCARVGRFLPATRRRSR
ncbi:MAG: methyltransferase family protein [Solirubrobacteraceae bacterium]